MSLQTKRWVSPAGCLESDIRWEHFRTPITEECINCICTQLESPATFWACNFSPSLNSIGMLRCINELFLWVCLQRAHSYLCSALWRDHQSLQNRGKYIMQTDGLAQHSLFHILNSFVQVLLLLKLASLLSTSIDTKLEQVCLRLSFCSTSYKVCTEDIIRRKPLRSAGPARKVVGWMKTTFWRRCYGFWCTHPIGQHLHWGSHCCRWGTIGKGTPWTACLPSCLLKRERGTPN